MSTGRAYRPGIGEDMEYEAKLRLNSRQYLAVLSGALVIVTENDKGEPIRWAIFGEEKADNVRISHNMEHGRA